MILGKILIVEYNKSDQPSSNFVMTIVTQLMGTYDVISQCVTGFDVYDPAVTH